MKPTSLYLFAILFAIFAADPHTNIWLYWKIGSMAAALLGLALELTTTEYNEEALDDEDEDEDSQDPPHAKETQQ